MALDGFDTFAFTHAGATRTVYTLGAGPAVVVMHEIPGITPQVERFARRVAADGFRVYLPHLFGEPGRPISNGYILAEVARACIRREFSVLARRQASPITEWLRALCRRAHEARGGPGVGAVGMCITGNFALALMVDQTVMAPVLSQPSLPFALTKDHRAALHLSDSALATIKQRAAGGCPVLGLRFTHDPLCPGERFATLRRELGPAFDGIEIDSSPGNAYGFTARSHSVLTTDLVDETGHPTRAALDRVLTLFRNQLRNDAKGA
ncbi:MAG: dienelactone hydrolase family protein [bacterium]